MSGRILPWGVSGGGRTKMYGESIIRQAGAKDNGLQGLGRLKVSRQTLVVQCNACT